LRAASLRTGNPLPLLLQVLLQVQQLRPRAGAVYTVLVELFSNALEHGVLGLDSNLKRDAEGFAQYYELRRQRLAELTTGHIHLELEIRSGDEGGYLRIGIQDSGPGFDVAHVLGERHGVDSLRGRGLRLIRQLSDGFDWQADGRGLSVEFRWSAHA